MRYILILSFFSLFLVSCKLSKTGVVDIDNYMQWYSKNIESFTDTIRMNTVKYSFRIVPVEVELTRQFLDNSITEDEIKTLYTGDVRQTLSGQLLVEFSNYGEDVYSNSKKEKQTVQLGLNEYIKVITNQNDTLKCVSARIIPGLQGVPRALFELDFGSIDRKKIEKIILDDQLWSNQIIAFKKSSLYKKEIPQLKFK